MRKQFAIGLFVSILAMPSPTYASDQPLYQPAPDWVVTAPMPDALLSGTGTPGPSIDLQERFVGGREWYYSDMATRFNSPASLAQNNVLTLPWIPDKGDLIIHELTIIRGKEHIDLLAKGQKFTVLRREESLEQRELTGILTATLAVEGLQVGDVLRLRSSITKRDPALRGRVQWNAPVVALPAKVSSASMRLSWPASDRIQWKVLGQSAVVTQQSRDAGFQTLSLTLPAPKPAEMPGDAPLRFRSPPMIEVSSFSDWRDVSKVMAPLYVTAGTILPDSPLAAEVARIEAATSDPRERTALALRSVQDNIRYLAVGMDGGNYIPQTPQKTWTVRYGDCKAKTLLLLAMLHAMKIDAEPVLASIGLDDLVTERVPSAAAFNHVFVRARIGGQSYWLDGTGTGTRLADLGDTPPLHNVLPVRSEGAVLESVPWHAPARPSLDIELAIDESASVDLPGVVDAKVTLRGEYANLLTLMTGQMAAKEKSDVLERMLTLQFGEGQIDGAEMSSDLDAATVTIKGRLVAGSAWKFSDRRAKRKLSYVAEQLAFSPDRSRATWTGIPVATAMPNRARYRVRIRLPEDGRGVTLEGTAGTTSDQVAGFTVQRTISVANGVAELDEVLTSDGREILPAAIPLERTNLAKAQARVPRLIAPTDARRRWQLAESAPDGGTQGKAIEAVYAKAISAAEPDDISGLTSRASYLRGVGNFAASLEDLKQIAVKTPSIDNLVAHGSEALALGDVKSALADGEEALKLDSSSIDAINLLAEAEAERGNLSRGLALIDERIALGGDDKDTLIEAKADLIGKYGDPHEATKLLDAMLVDKPGNAQILNQLCWIKGTRNFELDAALKNCTSAIELSGNTAPILDSRAMVWLRMGRLDDALRDLDAALLQIPALGPSRFVRGIVLAKLGRQAEAQQEFAAARRLVPGVERTYARYGLKP